MESSREYLFDVLGAFESEYFGKGGQGKFVRYREWYISEKFLPRLALYPFLSSNKKVPGLNYRAIGGGFKDALSGHRYEFPSRADCLLIDDANTRVRGFYLHNDPLVVKIVANSKERLARARKDLEMRDRVQTAGRLFLPKMRHVEDEASHVLSLEDVVFGRKFHRYTDQKLFGSGVLDPLLDTYRSFGLEMAPLSDFYDRFERDALPSIVANLDSPVARDFLERFESLLDADGSTVASICHGDLVPSNIAIIGNKPMIFDWEYAARYPIPLDLLKPLSIPKHMGVGRMWATLREALEGDFLGDYELEDYLVLHIAYFAARRPHNLPRALELWQRLSP